EQTLRYDPADGFGKPYSDLSFLRLIKHSHDAIDGLPSIDRVQRGHYQVTGFGRRHTNLNRLAVPHFADEDHLRSLPECGAKTRGKRAEVVSHLTLIERRLLL